MRHALDWTDGVETYRYVEQDGRLYRLHTSNNEDAILEQNAAVRGRGGPRRFEWGKYVASVPMAVLEGLYRRYPGLASKDPNECFRAWERLIRDPEYYKLTLGG